MTKKTEKAAIRAAKLEAIRMREQVLGRTFRHLYVNHRLLNMADRWRVKKFNGKCDCGQTPGVSAEWLAIRVGEVGGQPVYGSGPVEYIGYCMICEVCGEGRYD
jgi:hypothetical protein